MTTTERERLTALEKENQLLRQYIDNLWIKVRQHQSDIKTWEEFCDELSDCEYENSQHLRRLKSLIFSALDLMDKRLERLELPSAAIAFNQSVFSDKLKSLESEISKKHQAFKNEVEAFNKKDSH